MKFDLKQVEITKFDKKVGLRLPESPNNTLAEFVGILMGDGYFNNYPTYSCLEIAGNSRLDYNYLTNYITPMILDLFNLNPKIIIRKEENSMYLRIMSKGLNKYLISIGLIPGKKEKLDLPQWISENDEYMRHFIRGLIDTDGSLVLLNRKQKKYSFYPRISLSLKNENIIQLVGNWLQQQGLSVCFMKHKSKHIYKEIIRNTLAYRLNVNGRKQLEKWMQLISFKNERHLLKYEKYKSGAAGI